MNDRALNPGQEENLFQMNPAPADFWEQYFHLQQLTAAVDMADGRFSLKIQDINSGRELNVDSVRLRPSEFSIRH